mmetsp:Transcript_9285/g.8738  ORF Transcript_9285/g.8738 Transcript_9285/m.8738 type:complete len:213 (-) Transcript_9285:1786-2424(-)
MQSSLFCFLFFLMASLRSSSILSISSSLSLASPLRSPSRLLTSSSIALCCLSRRALVSGFSWRSFWSCLSKALFWSFILASSRATLSISSLISSASTFPQFSSKNPSRSSSARIFSSKALLSPSPSVPFFKHCDRFRARLFSKKWSNCPFASSTFAPRSPRSCSTKSFFRRSFCSSRSRRSNTKGLTVHSIRSSDVFYPFSSILASFWVWRS